MGNRDKNWKEEIDSIKNELIVDKVTDAIKSDPKKWQENMEDIGFVWVDDSQKEVEEENNARVENVNQEYLVAYFEGEIKYNENMIEIFINETELENSNYALFRKYFRAGNSELLYILISGLSRLPTNQVLLSGLSYFHEHRNILKNIIGSYIDACNEELDSEIFRSFCIEFIYSTDADGYDALTELKSMFHNDIGKNMVIEQITKMMSNKDGDVIEF